VAHSEAADQALGSLRTRVVSLLQSNPLDSDRIHWGPRILASIQRQSPRGKLMFAAAALGMILVPAGAGVYLLSQQKSGVDTTAAASAVETAGTSLLGQPETGQKNSGRFPPGSQLNQTAGELAAFKQARVFERQEQYDEAIKIYEEYMVRNP